MITHICVAIQILGAPAGPAAAQALQQHCDSVLGAGECRLTEYGRNDDKNECWRATLVRTADDAMASVVVGGRGAAAGPVVQRDVKFESNDERTDRWATLGLVVAALVTQQELAVASAPPGAATSAPAAETAPRAGSVWFSRDRSAPATISEQSEEPSRGPLGLADMRLLGVAEIGRLPWATVGLRLAATFVLSRRVDFQIGGAYLASTSATEIPVDRTSGVNFSLWSVTLGLCRRTLVTEKLTGAVCAGGDLGLMRATVSGGSVLTQNASALLPNAWGGFDSGFRLTRHLALVVEYKAEVSVTAPPSIMSVSGDLGAKVFQASRITQNLGVGIAGTF